MKKTKRGSGKDADERGAGTSTLAFGARGVIAQVKIGVTLIGDRAGGIAWDSREKHDCVVAEGDRREVGGVHRARRWFRHEPCRAEHAQADR